MALDSASSSNPGSDETIKPFPSKNLHPDVRGNAAQKMAEEMLDSFPTSPIPDDKFYQSLDRILPRPVPGAAPLRKRLRDEEFVEIAKWCKLYGKLTWSVRPRTFVILRMIGHLDAIDGFAAHNLTDYALPYDEYNLPPVVKGREARDKFLEYQQYVLTPHANELETPGALHQNILGCADKFFHWIRELGAGSFGSVDYVVSYLNRTHYARKRMSRGQSFQRNKDTIKTFENELEILKQLSHVHLIKLVGSYTDENHVGFIMTPVADMNLAQFLSMTVDEGQKACLRRFFGCLAVALAYLHKQKVRHKDIKPENILVKGQNVLLTDFGTSHNWADDTRSVTTGTVQAFTRRYCAPEVARYESRNESSDVWSLGCVYIEMGTVLAGRTIKEMRRFFDEKGTKSSYIRDNQEATDLWLTQLEDVYANKFDKQPVHLGRQMCVINQGERPTAAELVSTIRDFQRDAPYYGYCCEPNDDKIPIIHNTSDHSQHTFDDCDAPLPPVMPVSNPSLPDLVGLGIYKSPFVEDEAENTTVIARTTTLEPDQGLLTEIDPEANSGPTELCAPSPSLLMNEAHAEQPLETPEAEDANYEQPSASGRRASRIDQYPLSCHWPLCKQAFSHNLTPSELHDALSQHLRNVHGVHELSWSGLLTSKQDHGSPVGLGGSTDDPFADQLQLRALQLRQLARENSNADETLPTEEQSVPFGLLPEDRRPIPTSVFTKTPDPTTQPVPVLSDSETSFVHQVNLESLETLPKASIAPSLVLASANRFGRQDIKSMIPRSRRYSDLESQPLFVYGSLMFPSILRARAQGFVAEGGIYSVQHQRRLRTEPHDWSTVNVSLQHAAEKMTPALLKGYRRLKPRGLTCAAIQKTYMPRSRSRSGGWDPESNDSVTGFLIFGLSSEAMRCLDHLLTPEGCGKLFDESVIPHSNNIHFLKKETGRYLTKKYKDELVTVLDRDSEDDSDKEGQEKLRAKDRLAFARERIDVEVKLSGGTTMSVPAVTYVWDGAHRHLGCEWNVEKFVLSSSFARLSGSNEDPSSLLAEEDQLATKMGITLLLAGDKLCDAALKGDRTRLRTLLAEDHNVNAPCHEYGSVLQAAASRGDETTVRFLLRRNANIDARGGRYNSALIAAVTEGHDDVAIALLDQGADVLVQSAVYVGALYQAVDFSNQILVHALLEKGAWLTAEYGELLDLAAERGNRDIIAELQRYDVRERQIIRRPGERSVRRIEDDYDGYDSDSSGGSYRDRRLRSAQIAQDNLPSLTTLVNQALSLTGSRGKWTGQKAVRMLKVAYPNGVPQPILELIRPHIWSYTKMIKIIFNLAHPKPGDKTDSLSDGRSGIVEMLTDSESEEDQARSKVERQQAEIKLLKPVAKYYGRKFYQACKAYSEQT